MDISLGDRRRGASPIIQSKQVLVKLRLGVTNSVTVAVTKAAQSDDLEDKDGSFRAVPTTWRPQLLLQIDAAVNEGSARAIWRRTLCFILR